MAHFGMCGSAKCIIYWQQLTYNNRVNFNAKRIKFKRLNSSIYTYFKNTKLWILKHSLYYVYMLECHSHCTEDIICIGLYSIYYNIAYCCPIANLIAHNIKINIIRERKGN
jgi:hypothetical protein